MGLFHPRSESRSSHREQKAKQNQKNNDLDKCFACTPILLPLRVLFQAPEPVSQCARRPPPPPIEIPILYGKLKSLAKSFAQKQQNQRQRRREKEGPVRSPNSPWSGGFFSRPHRRWTNESDSKDSYRSMRSRRTDYSGMVSPTGTGCGLRDSPSPPPTPGTVATTPNPSVGYPATPRRATSSLGVGYSPEPVSPPSPPLLLSCSHIWSGLGGMCERCTEAAAYEPPMSGVDEVESAYESEPLLGFAPTPDTPQETATYEDQSSPVLQPLEKQSETPLFELGIEMPSTAYEEQSSLLPNSPPPPPTPPPAPKKRKERPAPVLITSRRQRRISWKFERNCDTVPTITAAPTHGSGSKATGAIFAGLVPQYVRKRRSTTFDNNVREMSCTLEHCERHGGDWDTAATIIGSNTTLAPSMHRIKSEEGDNSNNRPAGEKKNLRKATMASGMHGGGWDTIVGGNRDSGATLAPSMHSGKQHYGGRQDQVDIENGLELPGNKRRVSWIVDGLVAVFNKGVSWLRGKGWGQ
ncbi:hypothetical protein L873DRAFT_1820891 [Choiromyces venosus 120613-1]|uniref:Uncharacterized protein n=1 Tax=Choiromyces venosus 120613-1 TaxID=1336337 RepID=A0A3N4IZZ1_9PEZI|nr:hypothetical protein L873DRAFT_1820891 [Choiromyces venosus 120613-1]